MHSRNREELAVRCLLPRLWVLAGLKAAGHKHHRVGLESKEYIRSQDTGVTMLLTSQVHIVNYVYN